jgi:hypothetical protein
MHICEVQLMHSNVRSVIEKRVYRAGNQIALFEVGYKFLEHGCDYVEDPLTGNLEQIYGVEIGDDEGQECLRVETFPDKWYEIDGATKLAKKVSHVNKQ